jgi:hypothetical protein
VWNLCTSVIFESLSQFVKKEQELDNTRSRIHERTISLSFLLGITLKSSQTWSFCIQCLHYKPVSTCLWLSRRKTLKTFVPISTKNSASANSIFYTASRKINNYLVIKYIGTIPYCIYTHTKFTKKFIHNDILPRWSLRRSSKGGQPFV